MDGEDAQRSVQSLSPSSFDAVSSVHTQNSDSLSQNYSRQVSLFCRILPFATEAVSTLRHGVPSICHVNYYCKQPA